ncbi:MAG: LytTR family DNA-binding domain-containing protein [Flavobacterium sp.]|nr:LytTR family DNA-binding domain-containing protein [Flavobacterium sp.]
MRVVIIEDETLSAEHLALLLHKIDSRIEVVQYIESVKEAVTAFTQGLQADLLFVDIHLADGNSFSIFQQLAITTPVVFTTAYDHYAIQAFKQNSIDYLLKPIALKDLEFAIDKYKKQVVNPQLVQQIATTYQQLNKQYKTRFLVKLGSTINTINADDIQYFETKDSVTFLVSKKGSRYPIDYTLDQLETLLQPSTFFRINRKVILNITVIEKIENYFNGRLCITAKLLEGEAKIVSRERVSEFRLWLDN